MATVDAIAAEVAEVVRHGVELCLVIGGGGKYLSRVQPRPPGMERASADYMGVVGDCR